MFNTELKIETTEAARVLATAKCMAESKGKMVHLPSTKVGEPGQAVWSGLITRLHGSTNYDKDEYTTVYYITGAMIDTKLTLPEVMALMA